MERKGKKKVMMNIAIDFRLVFLAIVLYGFTRSIVTDEVLK